ncbi:MAG: glycosyltransferase [Erysipelotrichaceae bacterium]|nr:glycosyltransferase [Erysipelotrichaceae bacterium]
MNTNALISVIVPIYNVEKYLDRCIESIVNQTYKNLEIILVDDGSPDNCPKICDKWSKKDNRIKVIHKENGGLSDARNAGLDTATGAYIGFVDGDDFLDKKMYEILLKNLIKTKADMSICTAYLYEEKSKIKYKNSKNIQLFIYEGIDKYNNLFNNNISEFNVVWKRIYKKEIFKELRFPKGKINEDTFIAHKLLSLSNKIVYSTEKLYYYVQHENSIMHQKFNIKKLDGLEAIKEQMLFFQKEEFKNTKYQKISIERYMNNILVYYCTVKNHNENKQYQKQIQDLQKEYKKYYKEIMKKDISSKLKLKYFIFKYFPNIYYIIKRKKFMN